MKLELSRTARAQCSMGTEEAHEGRASVPSDALWRRRGLAHDMPGGDHPAVPVVGRFWVIVEGLLNLVEPRRCSRCRRIGK